MLTPAQVIPFLTHEQSAVRDMAVRYLSGAHDPAPATADDFWRAADALGFDTYEGREMALSASDLPQTDYSVDRMLGAIDGADGNDRGAELFRLRLLVELRDLPYEPLARHGERILACPHLTDAARAHILARLAPVTDSLDALWERLVAFSDAMRERYLDELDEPARALLVGAIARTPGGPERATAALGDYDPDAEAFDWTDVFCFDVIEEARYAPALDAVIGRLRTVPDDDDAVHEACARIIPLIGGASTVGPLAALAREAPWHAGLHATEALGRIKAPEAERALLELIGSGEAAEKEVDDAAYAALEALIPTGEGFDLLYGQARDGPSDPMWGDLRYSCVVVAEMTGRTLPESKQWRRHVDKIVAEDKRTRHLLTQPSEATLAAWRRRLDGLPEDVGDEEDDDFEDEEADEEFGLDSPVPELPDAVSAYLPPVAQTIRRDAPKVGRNDPCPCGSGKKYKKCCGGK